MFPYWSSPGQSLKFYMEISLYEFLMVKNRIYLKVSFKRRHKSLVGLRYLHHFSSLLQLVNQNLGLFYREILLKRPMFFACCLWQGLFFYHFPHWREEKNGLHCVSSSYNFQLCQNFNSLKAGNPKRKFHRQFLEFCNSNVLLKTGP